MSVKIVKIRNIEKYKNVKKKYGILMHSMVETAIINFDSNMGGEAVNVAHGDYFILPSNAYKIKNGKVFVYDYGNHSHGFMDVGLTVWSE